MISASAFGDGIYKDVLPAEVADLVALHDDTHGVMQAAGRLALGIAVGPLWSVHSS